jgi:hypothetical protein
MSTSHNPQTVTGGCHCGAVRYKAIIDLSTQRPTKCNCTYCHKANFVCINVDPDDPGSFKYTSHDVLANLGHYGFGDRGVNWNFCRQCGVNVSANGEYDKTGVEGAPAVRTRTRVFNAVTLDQDDRGLDLTKLKLGYFNGKDHGWSAEQQDEPAPWGSL